MEGDVRTERLRVYRRGLGEPQWATLKCRLRHHLRLCLSSHPTLSFLCCSPCPAFSLLLSRTLCLPLTQSVQEWAQSVVSPNCHIQPRKHNARSSNKAREQTHTQSNRETESKTINEWNGGNDIYNSEFGLGIVFFKKIIHASSETRHKFQQKIYFLVFSVECRFEYFK